MSHDAAVWLWWMVATTIGWAAGFWLGFFIGSIAFGSVMVTLCVGIMVGLLQWQVLQAEVPGSEWWAPAGVAGLLLAVGLASLAWGGGVLATAGRGLTFGLGLGPLLRHRAVLETRFSARKRPKGNRTTFGRSSLGRSGTHGAGRQGSVTCQISWLSPQRSRPPLETCHTW